MISIHSRTLFTGHKLKPADISQLNQECALDDLKVNTQNTLAQYDPNKLARKAILGSIASFGIAFPFAVYKSFKWINDRETLFENVKTSSSPGLLKREHLSKELARDYDPESPSEPQILSGDNVNVPFSVSFVRPKREKEVVTYFTTDQDMESLLKSRKKAFEKLNGGYPLRSLQAQAAKKIYHNRDRLPELNEHDNEVYREDLSQIYVQTLARLGRDDIQ